MEENLKKIFLKIEKIPTLPVTINNIISVLNNPKSSADDVNKAVSSDFSLSSKVLKLVNSSYYGLSKKVSSITQAIVLLGFNTIQSLALSAAVMDLFSTSENPNFKRSDFWDHSFAVALIAKLISRNLHINMREQETFFLCGLFHDIGKIVLDQYCPEEFNSVLEIVSIDGISMVEGERRSISTTHAEIGAKILERWKFPENLYHSVRYHHDPQLDEKYQQVTAIIYLSDFLCKAKRIGNSGDYDISGFSESVISKFSISPEMINNLIKTEIDRELTKAK